MDLDIDNLKKWIGKTELRRDLISPTPVQGLVAMLDQEGEDPIEGDAIPWLAHWLYSFTPIPRQSTLGPDGHPRRGGFLPPVPLPRRMWAGSEIEFRAPLKVGDVLERRSTILDVSAKQGRSGSLVFVRVRHELGGAAQVALVEQQDIVYRAKPLPGESAPAPTDAPAVHDFARTIHPDPTLLFRYSALTHNGHRIHYDRSYATEIEGYAGLVIHGPLIATLLLDLLKRNFPDAQLSAFKFRAVKPLSDTAPFRLCGRYSTEDDTVELWAQGEDGTLAMDATATLMTEPQGADSYPTRTSTR